MRGSPNNKELRRSPETGRRSRDLISGFRKMVKSEKTPESTRKWAADWLLYLEGFTDEKPSDKKPCANLTPHNLIGTPESGIQPAVETPEEEKLRELLKEQEDGTNTERQEVPSSQGNTEVSERVNPSPGPEQQ